MPAADIELASDDALHRRTPRHVKKELRAKRSTRYARFDDEDQDEHSSAGAATQMEMQAADAHNGADDAQAHTKAWCCPRRLLLLVCTALLAALLVLVTISPIIRSALPSFLAINLSPPLPPPPPQAPPVMSLSPTLPSSLLPPLPRPTDAVARTASPPPPAPTTHLPNLMPQHISDTPAYYSTWATQGYVDGIGEQSLSVQHALEINDRGDQSRALTSDNVFGASGRPGSGWARDFYVRSRSDLLFLLDDGFALGENTIAVNPAQFPEVADAGGVVEGLVRLREGVEALGWRGIGLWNRFCGIDSNTRDMAQMARWTRDAGIYYWKIDGPDLDCACQRAAKEVYPELIVEHGDCAEVSGCPMNNLGSSGVYDSASALRFMNVLGCSDVARVYDTAAALSVASTLSRLVAIHSMANTRLGGGTNQALVMSEESYAASALGSATATMRYPLEGLRPTHQEYGMSEEREVELFFGDARRSKFRIAEYDRVVLWSRIAPAFGARARGGTIINASAEILYDSWVFEPGDLFTDESDDPQRWYRNYGLRDVGGGYLALQGAPARVSRGGIPRPFVLGDGEATGSCRFLRASTAASIVNCGATATISATSSGNGGAIVGSADGADSASCARDITFVVEAIALQGEVIIGVGPADSNVNGWIGSSNVRAYAISSNGQRVDPSGHWVQWGDTWTVGDIIAMRLTASGELSFSRNGMNLGVAFTNVPGAFSLVPLAFFSGEGTSLRLQDAGCIDQNSPFVASAVYPNGAISVSTLGRTRPRPTGYTTPKAHVVQHLETIAPLANPQRLPPIGVFGGGFSDLTLVMPPALIARITTVLAQDLLGDDPEDVTSRVERDVARGVLRLPGAIVDEVGTSAVPSSHADPSEPAIVLEVRL